MTLLVKSYEAGGRIGGCRVYSYTTALGANKKIRDGLASEITAGFKVGTGYYDELLASIRGLMDDEFCDCGPHSTCRPGDEVCTGCGKKRRPNASKIEEVEE